MELEVVHLTKQGKIIKNMKSYSATAARLNGLGLKNRRATRALRTFARALHSGTP